MTKTVTPDEAREQLRESEIRYQEIEETHRQTFEGVSTAHKVLAQVETRAALEEAARDLLERREIYVTVDTEWKEQRRREAESELFRVEGELVSAVAEAEKRMTDLVPALQRVADLSKARYAHRKAAGWTASMATLARSAIVGWMQWRLQPIELTDLGTPPHHYRAPLTAILGLQGVQPEPNNADQQGDQQ